MPTTMIHLANVSLLTQLSLWKGEALNSLNGHHLVSLSLRWMRRITSHHSNIPSELQCAVTDSSSHIPLRWFHYRMGWESPAWWGPMIVNVPWALWSYPDLCMTAATFNCRSTRSKEDCIFEAVIDQDIDVLAFTETWLTDEAKDDYHRQGLSFPGYKLYMVPRPGGRSGGGVAILHKEGLTFRANSKSESGFTSFEHCDVDLTAGNRSLYVVVIYGPPSSARYPKPFSVFFSEFRTFLEEKVTMSSRLIILGKFKIYVDVISKSGAKLFLEMLDLLNFEQHVTTETQVKGHSFDLIITRSAATVVREVTVNRHTSSDHYLVVAHVQHPKPPSTRIMTITRKLRDLDATSLADVISHQITSFSRTTLTAGELADHYEKILSSSLDKLAPARTNTVTRRPSQKWYTDDLLAIKRRKRQASMFTRRYLSPFSQTTTPRWRLLSQSTSLVQSMKLVETPKH